MAAASLAATDERSNFVKLTRLLISTGTKVVRGLLDSFIPPANLTATLKSAAVYTRLQQMKRTRLLTQPQWSLLFPSPGTCGSSMSFDITLLFKLLGEFCGLTAPATGWDKLPNSTDLSLTADLARVKYYHNTLYGHVNEEMKLSDDEFKHYWKEIKDALLRIVAHYDPSKVSDWAIVINDLLTSPLPDDDRRNIEELKAWYLDEKHLKELVEKLSRQVKNLGNFSVLLGLDQSSFLSEKDGNASEIFSYLKTRHTAVLKTSCSSEIPLERRRGIVHDYCSKICTEKKHTKIITREKQEVITYETVSDLQYTFEELGIDIGNVNSSYVKKLNSYAKEISEADAVTAYLRQAARKILNRNSHRIHSIIPYHYQGQTAVVFYTYDQTQDLFENDWSEEFLGFSVFVIDLIFGYATEPPVLPKPYPTIPSEKQDNLNEIKDKITQKLSKKHSNLSTVAVDYRIKGNKLQKEICLQIGVLTKGIFPLGEEKVFSEIDWVFFDVIESSATLCFHDQTGILGVGIGVQGDNTSTGSLGAVVKHKDTGELFLLSNAHVLLRKGTSSSIVHPSLEDYEEDMKLKEECLESLKNQCQDLRSEISRRKSAGASTGCQEEALTRMKRQFNRVEEDCKEMAQPRIIATFNSQVNHFKKQGDYLCESHSKKYGIDAAIALIKTDEFNPKYVTEVYKWPRNFKVKGPNKKIVLNGSFKNKEEGEDLLNISDVVVYKCGRTTGVTKGTLSKEINVRLGSDDSATFVPISHESEDGATSQPEVSRLQGPKPELNNMWHNVLHIKSSTVKNAERRDFCADGDSGAVVFDEEGSCVGLLFGRIDTTVPSGAGLATPIHVVFDALKISLASADDFKIDQAQHVGEYLQPIEDKGKKSQKQDGKEEKKTSKKPNNPPNCRTVISHFLLLILFVFLCLCVSRVQTVKA